MTRATLLAGIAATLVRPAEAVPLAALRTATAVAIDHQQDPPGLERFAGLHVSDVIRSANRRRRIVDPAAIAHLVAALERSKPKLDPTDVFDCFWVARFESSRGAVLAVVSLNGFGTAGSIDGHNARFTSKEYLRALEGLVPNR